jgi:hypothetical protein
MSTTYILTTPRDEHGQPLALFNRANNQGKIVDQLHGICSGILADGVVTDDEVRFFHDWVQRHTAFEPIFPLTEILSRLQRIFADGRCDEEEREELKAIMQAVCGYTTDCADAKETYSCTLPLDNPQPAIEFPGKLFNVTGKFAYGTRKKVMEAISAKGGKPTDTPPTRDSDYLLIGLFASRDWANTSFGRKIEKAVALRESGMPIAIVCEEHWRRAVA